MEDKLRILLCEDDESLGMLLREYLQAKGYDAELYPDGEAGYKAFLKSKYDMCVLDVMMPKKDGFALANEIRQVNAEIPIIFLTAKNLKEDVKLGYEIGADDYIVKPFDSELLIFKIKAILSRSKHEEVEQPKPKLIHIGQYEFNTELRVISKNATLFFTYVADQCIPACNSIAILLI